MQATRALPLMSLLFICSTVCQGVYVFKVPYMINNLLKDAIKESRQTIFRDIKKSRMSIVYHVSCEYWSINSKVKITHFSELRYGIL